MERNQKLAFIFETGKRLRFFMDDQVMRDASENEGAPFGGELSCIQMKAAMDVYLHQPLGLSELAGRLGITSPSASGLVERLVEKRVLSRDPDPADRRRVLLTIHPDSRADMDLLHRRFQRAFDKIASKVGDRNVERWYEVMLQVRELLSEEEAKLNS